MIFAANLKVQELRFAPAALPGVFAVLMLFLLFSQAWTEVWHIKTVDDEAYVGRYNSLALDVSGSPHISYQDWENEDLKYAFWEDSCWCVETVDTVGAAGFGTALALDQMGIPHVIYRDGTDGWLRYARRSGATWEIAVVDHQTFIGYDMDIALDPFGYVHISYYDWGNADLKYALFDGSSWSREVVESAGNVGSENSLAIDQDGCPHISYYDATEDLLKHAVKGVSGWSIEIVDTTETAGGLGTSLAVDSMGKPHIAYTYLDDFTSFSFLAYARESDTGWQIQTVNSMGYHDMPGISMALDGADFPHISYSGLIDFTLLLRLAWKTASGWEIAQIGSDTGVGESTSIALAPNGRCRITYFIYGPNELRYAYEAPESVALRVYLQAGDLLLKWESYHGTAAYWVYGSAVTPWFSCGFEPGFENRIGVLPPSSTTYVCSNGIGDPDSNWTYLVIAVEETDSELAQSNRAGECDFESGIP